MGHGARLYHWSHSRYCIAQTHCNHNDVHVHFLFMPTLSDDATTAFFSFSISCELATDFLSSHSLLLIKAASIGCPTSGQSLHISRARRRRFFQDATHWRYPQRLTHAPDIGPRPQREHGSEFQPTRHVPIRANHRHQRQPSNEWTDKSREFRIKSTLG